MYSFKKSFKRLMGFMLAIAMVFTLNITSLTAEAAETTVAAPESSTVTTATGIVQAHIGGNAATFYVDDNDSSNIYMRYVYPTGTEPSALENVTVTLLTQLPVTSSDVTVTASGATKSFTANLLNNAPSFSVAGKTYIVGASIAEWDRNLVTTPMTGYINSATINGATASVTRKVTSSQYPGNIYLEQQNLTWVTESYLINATNVDSNASAANLAYTISGGSSGSATINLSSGSNDVTIGGQKYTVSASFVTEGDKFVASPSTFWIDFQELRNSSYASDPDYADELALATAIETGVTAYYNNNSTQREFAEGTSCMTVLQTILQWCADNGYISASGTTLGSNVTYVEEINGLGEFSVGALSGWMYTDNPSSTIDCTEWYTPAIGAASYSLTADSTIAWLYTVDYTTHGW